jgi:hypothetical protein
MTNSTRRREYSFDKPGIYCIRVFGFIDKDYTERFAGMDITTRSRGEEEPITTLVGKLPDQASLSGILEALYESHLTLVSVEML